MGISDNASNINDGSTNAQSTNPVYKPRKPYFYPVLKIHKIKKGELKPGVEPPIRLITALQESVTKRSDVFLAQEYLFKLEKDYCKDLLVDTTHALKWLEELNGNLERSQNKHLKAFSFDFKALYDSLSPKTTIEALECAIDECRQEWSVEFKQWIIKLIRLSFEASIGQFDGNWYKQTRGVPTGGSICVQISNITVYYILRKTVYSDMKLMKPVISVKRYIDDGAGFFHGTKREFSEFIKNANRKLHNYGLNIDEYSISYTGSLISFLDIQFCFQEGSLQTDLHIKETDSKMYLYYGSCHPNHVYASIVYSQCLRLRRIINNDVTFANRIDELKECFYKSNFPKSMVENISSKVKLLPRKLPDNNPVLIKDKDKETENKITVVSTFGNDSSPTEVTKKYEKVLINSTKSFIDNKNFGLVTYVKKRVLL